MDCLLRCHCTPAFRRVSIIHFRLWEFRSIWFGYSSCCGYNAPRSHVMSITALVLHPLGPALVLGLGALLVALSRRVIPDPLPVSGATVSSQTQASFDRWRLRL